LFDDIEDREEIMELVGPPSGSTDRKHFIRGGERIISFLGSDGDRILEIVDMPLIFTGHILDI
jgi:hypothetical protein